MHDDVHMEATRAHAGNPMTSILRMDQKVIPAQPRRWSRVRFALSILVYKDTDG